MLSKIAGLIIPSKNERKLKSFGPLVEEINALEAGMKALPESAFPEKTEALKHRWKEGETLDDLLPEAFALVREASQRTIGERHFDV